MKLFVVVLFAASVACISGLSIARPESYECPIDCESPEKAILRRILDIPELTKEIWEQIPELDDGTPVKDILNPENLGPAPSMCLINQLKLKYERVRKFCVLMSIVILQPSHKCIFFRNR